MDSEYLEDICKRADYYGMESLTEEEQCILEKSIWYYGNRYYKQVSRPASRLVHYMTVTWLFLVPSMRRDCPEYEAFKSHKRTH